jgi:aryl-alcohol dehydrogenase-like predicted oxidoreductase
VSGPAQADVIRRALDVSVDGENPFQVVQATWNLLERSAGPALAEAKSRGWGVIVKEALANGRLAEHADGALVALAAALSQPWADVVLSGAVTIEQLGSNLKAVALSQECVDWPDIAESPSEYWARRSALPWQ